MNNKTKKFTLATVLVLSLLGAGTLTSQSVAANDRLVSTQAINGQSYNILNSEVTSASSGTTLVGIEGTFLTPDKQAILDRINAIRKEAADEGLVTSYVPIKWSTALEKTAFVRAAEASITIDHTRLSSKDIWTSWPAGNFSLSENLAWNYNGFMKAIQQWYDEKADYVKSRSGVSVTGQTGHYKSLIDPKLTYMGLAAFENPATQNGWITVAQSFGTASGGSEELAGGYGKAIQYTEANSSQTQTFATKANLFDKDLNAIGNHKTKTENTNSSQKNRFNHSQYFGSWIQSNGRWWFKHNDGSYTSNGWEKINRTWYRFDNAGWMQTGWVKYGSWYYLDGSGAMKTGWLKDNGSWYYLQDSGAMKTGWMKVSGKWYYAYSSGALAINTTTPDGYRVNANGEWVG
ncbi:CAP domain-containing protein [Streptococcus pneumoniae]|uniref:CAP domain-containing protein n=1 Tax=Streptococcus pneumoniae TaxID=1313 RepID=UPI0005DCCAC0|nr:CAP domain-containing protein [Streptococcus pneumoniae]CIZ74884.1 choline binding protein CbpI [Streptococcus pneumoniae]COA82187.1 choline binding protein CbpI [Streptococcus pneumoniae]COQ29760.1 choline binding protein CbpI [Streptococcus pneumoniae]